MVTTPVANPRRTQAGSTFVAGVTANAARVVVTVDGVSATAEASCDACGYKARGYGFGGSAKVDAETGSTERIIKHMKTYHRALTVGDGVTRRFPQDAYGYVVVDVSKNGKVATLAAMPTDPASLGGEPSGFIGPFPVWSKTYSQDELDDRVTVFLAQVVEGRIRKDGGPSVTRISLRKDGKWRPVGANYVGSEFATGGARYYRDHSF